MSISSCSLFNQMQKFWQYPSGVAGVGNIQQESVILLRLPTKFEISLDGMFASRFYRLIFFNEWMKTFGGGGFPPTRDGFDRGGGEFATYSLNIQT